jgi:clan AA aspartic protease
VITGAINADLEAIIRVTVRDASGHQITVEAVVDTGFSGFLTLPAAHAAGLDLPWVGQQRVMLADGSVHLIDVYEATIIWDGQTHAIDIDTSGAESLIGMSLLNGFELRMQVRPGGTVSITGLP